MIKKIKLKSILNSKGNIIKLINKNNASKEKDNNKKRIR